MFWGSYRCEKWGKHQASLHAENRAIDWHLDVRAPADRRAAERLIRLLLAPDAAGNPQALARRMGVEELIWDCGYWGAGMTEFSQYSPCFKRGRLRKHVNPTVAHRDHVHIGMTRRGRRGPDLVLDRRADDRTPYSLDASYRSSPSASSASRALGAGWLGDRGRPATTSRCAASPKGSAGRRRPSSRRCPTSCGPRVVEPEAGAAGRRVASEPAVPTRLRAAEDPAPHASRSRQLRRPTPGRRRSRGAGGGVNKATALSNGVALPPLEAPEAVQQIIEAGNSIARTPYKWGGGHGKWQDTGYDCSGSVSFALAAAGLLGRARCASGPLMSWGERGPGKWVTIYTNPGHVYLEVAGIRFDTSGARKVTGSRWQNDLRTNAGFVARHPAGL